MFGWAAGEFNWAVAGLAYVVPALLSNLEGVGQYAVDKVKNNVGGNG